MKATPRAPTSSVRGPAWAPLALLARLLLAALALVVELILVPFFSHSEILLTWPPQCSDRLNKEGGGSVPTGQRILRRTAWRKTKKAAGQKSTGGPFVA